MKEQEEKKWVPEFVQRTKDEFKMDPDRLEAWVHSIPPHNPKLLWTWNDVEKKP